MAEESKNIPVLRGSLGVNFDASQYPNGFVYIDKEGHVTLYRPPRIINDSSTYKGQDDYQWRKESFSSIEDFNNRYDAGTNPNGVKPASMGYDSIIYEDAFGIQNSIDNSYEKYRTKAGDTKAQQIYMNEGSEALQKYLDELDKNGSNDGGQNNASVSQNPSQSTATSTTNSPISVNGITPKFKPATERQKIRMANEEGDESPYIDDVKTVSSDGKTNVQTQVNTPQASPVVKEPVYPKIKQATERQKVQMANEEGDDSPYIETTKFKPASERQKVQMANEEGDDSPYISSTISDKNVNGEDKTAPTISTTDAASSTNNNTGITATPKFKPATERQKVQMANEEGDESPYVETTKFKPATERQKIKMANEEGDESPYIEDNATQDATKATQEQPLVQQTTTEQPVVEHIEKPTNEKDVRIRAIHTANGDFVSTDNGVEINTIKDENGNDIEIATINGKTYKYNSDTNFWDEYNQNKDVEPANATEQAVVAQQAGTEQAGTEQPGTKVATTLTPIAGNYPNNYTGYEQELKALGENPTDEQILTLKQKWGVKGTRAEVEQNSNRWLTQEIQRVYGNNPTEGNDGVTYVLNNGKKIPLTSREGIVTIGRKRYKRNPDSGEWEEYEGETPEERAGLFEQDVYGYFDANGGDVYQMTEDNIRTLRKNHFSEYNDFLQKYNISPLWSEKRVLEVLRNNYKKYKDDLAEQAAITKSAMDYTTDKPRKVKVDGEEFEISANDVNEFYHKMKEYMEQGFDPTMMFNNDNANDPRVRDFQTYMYDYMERTGLKQKYIEKFGEDMWRKNIDNKEGNHTVREMIWILSMLTPDQKADLGIRDDGNGGITRNLPKDTWLSDMMEEDAINKEKEFEIQRNERQKSWNGMADAIWNGMDAIAAGGGVDVKDRTKEIGEDAQRLEDRYNELRKEYDTRLDTLRKEQKAAKEKREEERIRQQEAELQRQFQAEQNALNRELRERLQREQNAWKSGESALDREATLRAANINAKARETAAKIATDSKRGENLNKNFVKYNINGQTYYFSKNQKGVEANILKAVMPQGWTKHNIISAVTNGSANDATTKAISDALGDVFPTSTGDNKLDIKNVLLAVNNLMTLKGQNGIDSAKIDDIAGKLESGLVAQGAISETQLNQLFGSSDDGSLDVTDED